MRIVFILFLLLAYNRVQSQVVTAIDFEGISRTKVDYLEQFLSFEMGDKLDSAALETTRQRLVILEMFADVKYKVAVDEENATVTFQCVELHTLLPIFNFGGISENFWFQIGASEVNLAGRGHKVTSYYQYYDRHSMAFHLSLNRIKKSKWGANLNLIKWSTLEPLFFEGQPVDYEYDNYTFGLDAVRYLNFQDHLTFGVALFSEKYQRQSATEIGSAPAEVDKLKFLGKIILTQNRLDYFYYFLDGWHNQLNLQTVQSFSNDPPFYIVFNDLKRFVRIGAHGNFASRLRLGLSSNEESPFAPFVLDSYLNIRGVGNRVDRGTGAIVLNLEYRHRLMDRKKWAIQTVAFSDTGSWRNPGGDLDDFSNPDNFQLFAGAGIRIIQKEIFNAILRVDYGINLQDQETRGFVLGLGQYF